MAIAHDNSASNQFNGGATSVTIASFAVGAGADRLLFVGSGNSAGYDGESLVSTTTFNGVGVTAELWDDRDLGASSIMAQHGAYLTNPANATASVVVTFIGTPDEGCVGAIALTGVDQTTPAPGATAGAVGNSTTASVSITSQVDEWVVSNLYSLWAASTPGGSAIERWAQDSIAGSTHGAGSTLAHPVTAMSWNQQTSGYNNEWSLRAHRIAAATAGAPDIAYSLPPVPIVGPMTAIGY